MMEKHRLLSFMSILFFAGLSSKKHVPFEKKLHTLTKKIEPFSLFQDLYTDFKGAASIVPLNLKGLQGL